MTTITTDDGLQLHLRHWPATAAAARGQLLIVHGLGEHIERYAHVATALNAQGWDVHGWDHRGHGRSQGRRGDIPDSDAMLRDTARVVDAVRQPGRRFVLIGHSMGGLAARAYLRHFGGMRVQRLLTLGTPHGGSALARLGLGRNARQMESGSEWLRALALSAVPVETVSIYSPRDNYVMPQDSMALPTATKVTLDGLGHLAMLFSPRVAGALLVALDGSL